MVEPVSTTATANPPVIPVRPDHIPEKFWDAEKGVMREEAFFKSYTELEKKVGVKPPADADATGAIQLPVTPQPVIGADDTADTVLQKAGLDPLEVGKTFIEKGELTAEQYAALYKVGQPRPVVDAYLKSQVAEIKQQHQQAAEAAATAVGGQDKMDALLSWARRADALTIDDRANFNSLAANPKTAVQAMEWLDARYAKAVGADGSRPLVQAGTGATGSAPFTSMMEYVNAMNDERYAPTLGMGVPNPKHDPNYQRAADARAAGLKH